MSRTFEIGLALALASGVTSGGCMLPIRLLRHWKWENLWLVFSTVALLIVPWSLALLLIPELFAMYLSVPTVQCAIPVLFGVGWGLAQVLFGLTIARLGLALGYAIVMGFVSVLGTLVPLAAHERARYETNALIFWGVGAMALGIVASGWGGWLRDKASSANNSSRSIAYGPALALAIACGLLSPMLNYAFAFSEPIRSSALQRGMSPATAGYAVWPLVLTAGFLPNVAYSVYLLHKNRTGVLFKHGGPDATLAIVMGILWMGSLALYGMSAACLGDLGTSVGWGIVQALALITAAILGGLTREWNAAGKTAGWLRLIGVSLLVVATLFMASGAALRG
jgi:L-rhamnose-H+ transport protein